jgi:protein-S-isoprenylcysteine O-methyltransferase Ste14
MYISLPAWLRFAGFGLGLFALTLLAFAHHDLGKNFSMSVIIKKEQKLVTTGSYRWIRHPIYVAYLLIFLAIFLLSGNWVAGITGEAVIFTLMNGRLKIEEQLLFERFGRSHTEYVSSTGKFFPKLNQPGGNRVLRFQSRARKKPKEAQDVGNQ